MRLATYTLILTMLGFSTALSGAEMKVSSIERQLGFESQPIVKQGEANKLKIAAKNGGGDLLPERHSDKQGAAPKTRLYPDDRDLNGDFWIYDSWVTLVNDIDFDGYYSTVTVEFDVDTTFLSAEIYARLYLTRGEVFEEYHTSSIFNINGDSSVDSIVIESELLSGFPPGDYEMLIEVYDARDDSLVAITDGLVDVDLSLLPLESRNNEYEESRVIVTSESGGSFGVLMLLLAPLLLRRMTR